MSNESYQRYFSPRQMGASYQRKLAGLRVGARVETTKDLFYGAKKIDKGAVGTITRGKTFIHDVIPDAYGVTFDGDDQERFVFLHDLHLMTDLDELESMTCETIENYEL